MAVTGDLGWLAQGVHLLGGRWQALEPDLIQVELPPKGWAQLEGRFLSPFFPPPPAPPRLWALTEEVWRAHPEAEWLLPGGRRLHQWTRLAEERARGLAARWVGAAPADLSPTLILLWRVTSSGSGRLAWTLATTTRWPEGPASVEAPKDDPVWATWAREGLLEPATPPARPRGFRRAFAVTLEALAHWLVPQVRSWARKQRERWEAERAQLEAYYRAVAQEKGDPSLDEELRRQVEELERNLAPRLRARPLLGLLLYLPEEAHAQLLPAEVTQGRSPAQSPSAAALQARQQDP